LSYAYDLICIGSGPAGQRAAVQAAKLGKRVAVVEKRQVLGGVCVETGTIPSKTLREAIRSFRAVRRFDLATGGAMRRPSVDQLRERVSGVVSRENEVMRDQLTRNDIEVLCGSAKFKDPHTILVTAAGGEVKELSTAFVMVAVGTHPSDPPGVKPDGRCVITSDGMLDLSRMPRSLAVVGAGVIGIEYASMFAALGIEVVVVDKRSRPLEFLDFEVIDELVHQMRNMNTTFRLGEAVASVGVVEGDKPQGIITLESGKHIVADLILFSVGRIGATAALDLPAAGLSADERGRLTVDEHFRTSVLHIYAAGDVIGFPSLAATSSEQGRRAACHMFGLDSTALAGNFPIGIYSIPEVSMVGATEEQLTKDKVPYETGMARYREIARGQIQDEQNGLFKMLFHRETGRLLGVHIIGQSATELIHVGQAVLTLGGGLDYFLNAVFNYPTFAECYKVAAYDASNKMRRAATLQRAAKRA
jgi:NAD(P) transhydrogenase